ncbi:MAG: L-seryl-tRNA(Sec) selenium transferase [Chloroflexaceae bacterium]|nr:L-seryl-tRNA(Sec) selenium transferase [Chloroflexaceae bacterium]
MTPLRNLPSVDKLVQAVQRATDTDSLPRALVVQAARTELDATRAQLQAANGAATAAPPLEALVQQVQQRLEALTAPSLRPVINATGVIIQTNLGRAPLSAAARAAMQAVSLGYSNLEYDLAAGTRGSRTVHLSGIVQQLTGAEAALAVNNNAAAVYLVLLALAVGREVIVSRGQAVEIGGGFRIPDVLRQSGALLVEVGTTNRTYPRDYEQAINANTALLLRVHTSNFRLVGFVHETSLEAMAAVGRKHGIPVLDDLGSGSLLPTTPYGLAPEPLVQESIAAGADLVTFSGDKLLGGPQAGIIAGRADLIERLKKHPLARALRVDKTTIAGLEATLQAYLRGQALTEIPVWQMIGMPLAPLHQRATALAAQWQAAGIVAQVTTCASAVGGGSLPGETLPSVGVTVDPGAGHANRLAQALRMGAPAVVARIADDNLLFDVRTVLPEQDAALAQRVADVWQMIGKPAP